MTSGLPVKNIDDCSCWENVQYAFLCMSDEQFDLFLLTDAEILERKKQNNKTKNNSTVEINNPKKRSNEIRTGDNYLDEIEKAFENGDSKSIEELLKNL